MYIYLLYIYVYISFTYYFTYYLYIYILLLVMIYISVMIAVNFTLIICSSVYLTRPVYINKCNFMSQIKLLLDVYT